MLKIWLAQWRQPRYMLAGVLHIVVFFGFLILAARSTPDGGARLRRRIRPSRLRRRAGRGLQRRQGRRLHRWSSWPWSILAVRRAVFKPARYAVPEKLGKDHTPEALLVLGLIATLMVSESVFEGALLAAQGEGAQLRHRRSR